MGVLRKFSRLVSKAAYKRAIIPTIPNERFSQKTQPPRKRAGVYWVGHSLMNETASSSQGDINVMTMVEQFAKARAYDYSGFDHTLYGAPLSLQWRGQTHSYTREALAQKKKAEALAACASDYDTFVLTEIVPVHTVFELEFSAYYLQQFVHTIRSNNPKARIFIYESWDYWNGSRGGAQPWHVDWAANMRTQRSWWEKLSDIAVSECAVSPDFGDQIRGILSPVKPKPTETPIFIVPVGQAFLRLYDYLENPTQNEKLWWANGQAFVFSDMFKNPCIHIPESWPLAKHETPPREQQLIPRNPTEELDDIHASIAGIYLSALVHFATVYGQSPVGLPGLDEFTPELNALFQKIAWDAVINDLRSGISAA